MSNVVQCSSFDMVTVMWQAVTSCDIDIAVDSVDSAGTQQGPLMRCVTLVCNTVAPKYKVLSVVATPPLW